MVRNWCLTLPAIRIDWDMPLLSLSLRGFRNLDDVEMELSSGANYLFGPNAAGKTNLLEAVHYLAIGRSFRRSPDRELLGFDRECLIVAGKDSRGQTGEIRYDGKEKRILRNGAAVERLSGYLGWLPSWRSCLTISNWFGARRFCAGVSSTWR